MTGKVLVLEEGLSKHCLFYNPSVCFADSSLYTKEPILEILRLRSRMTGGGAVVAGLGVLGEVF